MYDLEFIIAFSKKYEHRIADFKKYGLVNLKNRKVCVNVVLSGEDIADIDEGWDENIKINKICNESKEYVANLYRFYLSLNVEDPSFRWLIRLDDDSCTDVDMLVSNLDTYYDYNRAFYLGCLAPFQNAINGSEGPLFHQYKDLLGSHLKILHSLKNEIECGIMSQGAAKIVLKNQKSIELIEKRAKMEGGYSDCLIAIACVLAKVYPQECPFVSHNPLINDFSFIQGNINHIHQISRFAKSENNWSRSTKHCFTIISKEVDKNPTSLEKYLLGKRLILENDQIVKIIEFKKLYCAKIKLENKNYNWYEENNKIFIIENINVLFEIKLNEDKSYYCDGFSVKEL